MSIRTISPRLIVKSQATPGTAAHSPHDADGSVNERGLCAEGATGEGAGNGRRAPNLVRRTHPCGRQVGSEHDPRVEQRDERLEVTAA